MDSWQRYSLKDLCSIVRGGSPRPISQYITSGEGYNWLKIGDTQNISKYIYQTKQKIKKEGLKKTRLVHKNDFILSNSMSFGKPFIMQTEACIHDGWLSLSISDPSVLDTDFLYYLLSSQLMFRKFNERAAGSSVRNLKIELVNEVEVYLPPLPEQKAIADILQAWDTAIEKTEALIAAKEKQFSWLRSSMIRNAKNTTSVNFRDLLTESRIVDKQNDVQKRLTVRLHLKGVDIRDFRGTESEKATQYYVRKSGQLIYGKQNVFRGSIGIVPKKLDGYSSSQDIPAFDIAESIYADWLFWYMSRPAFYKKLEHFAAGSGSKRFHPKELFKLAISTPPLSEQKRIAHTLNTAKREIDTLKTLADRYRTQKRGLMQKLLTGKWRVKL